MSDPGAQSERLRHPRGGGKGDSRQSPNSLWDGFTSLCWKAVIVGSFLVKQFVVHKASIAKLKDPSPVIALSTFSVYSLEMQRKVVMPLRNLYSSWRQKQRSDSEVFSM